jgi:hypothetical protein
VASGGGASSPQILHSQFIVQTGHQTITAPLVTPVDIGDAWLLSVRVQVPSGPSGCLGLRLVLNGLVVIPWQGTASNWLFLDDTAVDFGVETEVDQHIQIHSFNTGFWLHSSYWMFTYIPMVSFTQSAPIVLNIQ